MANHPKITFSKNTAALEDTVVAFVFDDLALAAPSLKSADLSALVSRAAESVKFKGAFGKVLDLPGVSAENVSRLILVGLGSAAESDKIDWLKLGGLVAAALGKVQKSSVLLSAAALEVNDDNAAQFVLGLRLRSYSFDQYKTKLKDDEKAGLENVSVHVADESAAKKAWKHVESIAEGVELARTLVNEPPNVIYPETFADRAAELEKLGVEIEVLDEKKLSKLGFGALLAVGQGSHRESRVVVMHWNGGAEGEAPVAIVGKGVTFDTGGISIKPAASMEDMKGDMAGAACVVGLMHALAARKAKANVIGFIGLVENMPDGKAYRPGDILTSLSGQTIEVVNTDAEGRLVLADVLWYAQDKYKPAVMINLATLTGAVLVALGQEVAGLFSNNDELAQRLSGAGDVTQEEVWRLPLGKKFDKLIDSRFADMKNSGGRFAGSITAAQFLQRFVNETPWAHLDIAGTGMAAVKNDINTSWGSGWGVRLLDRFIADNYEK